MDNFQQPTQINQPNKTPLSTIPIMPKPPKSKRWLYIVSGILLVGVVATAGIVFFKLKSSQTELASPTEEVQTSPINTAVEILTLPTEEIQTSPVNTTVETKNESRAIFAVVEGLKMNIYSSKKDGTDKKLLLSQDISEPDTRVRPFTVIDIKVSPTKNLIAYRFSSA